MVPGTAPGIARTSPQKYDEEVRRSQEQRARTAKTLHIERPVYCYKQVDNSKQVRTDTASANCNTATLQQNVYCTVINSK
jgi:hypothetical protein